MDSEQLAREVRDITLRCSSRIVNEGRVQYEYLLGEETKQMFEAYSDEYMLKQILEEIEDSINHLVMLHIRVRRIGEEANRYAARQRGTS